MLKDWKTSFCRRKRKIKHMRAKQGKLRVVIKVKWLSYFLPYCKKGFLFGGVETYKGNVGQ